MVSKYTDKIICGDCLEVMHTIPDKSIDMVLADLPYGVTACKWDIPIDLDALWVNWLRICKGAIVLTSTQPFTSRLVMSQPALFRHEWIWVKNVAGGYANAKRMPLRNNEHISVFAKAGYTYNPQPKRLTDAGMQRYKYGINRTNSVVYGGKKRVTPPQDIKYGYPKAVIKFNLENNRQHPTQKPVALFEYLIRTYTNEGETVLDPTAGSGTTAVACHKSNRHYICIEKEPEYCAIAEKRTKEML